MCTAGSVACCFFSGAENAPTILSIAMPEDEDEEEADWWRSAE